MKRYLNVCIGVVILIIIGVGAFLFFGKYSTDNIENYPENMSKKVCGSFFVFPVEVNNEVVNDYSYIRYNGFLDNGYQIYLECEYGEDEYEQEILRLSNINGINTDTDCAYVTINNFDSTYEYAMTDEENRIIRYIFLSHFPNGKINFDKSFMPENVLGDSDSYNVYATYDSEIGGWTIED